MNRKALTSIAALALLGVTAAATRAQSSAPAPPAPTASTTLPAPPARPSAAPAAPPVIAAAPRPAAAPQTPAPPQEPAPPALATTLFVAGNFLGVRTEEVTRENAGRYGLSGEPRGVGVREVVKGSPAEKAGLRANDVIVRFDGEPVTSVRKLTRLIEESAPEHSVRLTVLRGGAEQELSATLTRREPFVSAVGDDLVNVYPGSAEALRRAEELMRDSETWKRNEQKMREQWEEMARKHPGLFGSTRRIGVTTSALGKQLADYFGVTHGLLVSSVEEGSPAEKAGLKAGDIVTEADGQKVEDSDDLSRAIGAKPEGEVTLTVVRDRKSRTVRVTPERRPVPRGLLTPGTFRLFESPVAAITLPHMLMRPDLLSVPPTVVTPRLLNAPRIRVFGPGERVL